MVIFSAGTTFDDKEEKDAIIDQAIRKIYNVHLIKYLHAALKSVKA